MKPNLMLTIASLLSILFMTLHLTSDTVHARVGTAEAGGSTLIAVPILVVWLYGTLVLAERRSGYIIMLVGSLLASGMPVIHVMGAGGVFRGQIAKSSLLVRLDASRARRDWDVLPHPLGTRTVEPAMGPVPVVQQPEHEKARRAGLARGVAARQGSRRASNSMSPRGKKRTLEGAGQRGMKAGAQAIFIQRFA